MRITILIAGLALFSAGVALSFVDKAGGATATYAAAVFCLIFVYLSQFKRFKGFGLEAELQEKIAEADEALKKLRGITVPMAHMLFTMVSRMGRWGSMVPRRQRYEIMSNIEDELKKNGVSQQDLEKAKVDWHRYNIIDLARPIINGIAKVIDEEIKKREKAHLAFRQPIRGENLVAFNRAIEHWREACTGRQELLNLLKLEDQTVLARELGQIISSSPAIPDARRVELQTAHQEHLEDLKHYIKFHEFRRPEEWFGGEKE